MVSLLILLFIYSILFSSLYFYISCTIQKGYYQDDFILDLNEEPQKFLPIMNKGTWSRIKAVRDPIEEIINKALETNTTTTDNNNNDTIQIINLGCGLDSLHFYLKNKFSSSNTTTTKIKSLELDYKDICKRKVTRIKKSDKIKQILNLDTQNNIIKNQRIITSDYKLIDCELSYTNFENLTKILGYEFSEFNSTSKTIVVAECLFSYMETEDIECILGLINKLYPNTILIYYDLINPNDDFGKMLLTNLKHRDIRVPGLMAYPSLESHIERNSKLGFSSTNITSMNEYFTKHISNEEKAKVSKLEFIDEIEEFILLQKHACICYASNNSENKIEEYEFSKKFN